MEIEVMRYAAREAGKILMDRYGKVNLSYKEDKTIVTEADLESEKRIKEILSGEYPDYSVLGEESGYAGGDSEYSWIIDPLDGTTNYSIENPFFNVSIALAKKSEPIAGVIYYPAQDELFSAEKGKGAYLNDRKIEVSKKDEFEKSVLTFCHAPDKDSTEKMARIWLAWKLRNPKVRQIGAGALEMAYVACGRTECFLMVRMNPWDVAAGTVLVREAGGRVTDLKGEEFTTQSADVFASNGLLHDEILSIVQESL